MKKVNRSRQLAARQYNCAIIGVKFELQVRVLLKNRELSACDRNKIVRPRIGPYLTTVKLSLVVIELNWEVDNCYGRVHGN